MLTFPALEPNISTATNCAESYTENVQDSAITTTTDANYKITRPRTTKMLKSWSFSWVALSDTDYATINEFWQKVGTFEMFNWVNPIDGKVYIVRFTEAFSFQYVHPAGWQGTLKFEEV